MDLCGNCDRAQLGRGLPQALAFALRRKAQDEDPRKSRRLQRKMSLQRKMMKRALATKRKDRILQIEHKAWNKSKRVISKRMICRAAPEDPFKSMSRRLDALEDPFKSMSRRLDALEASVELMMRRIDAMRFWFVPAAGRTEQLEIEPSKLRFLRTWRAQQKTESSENFAIVLQQHETAMAKKYRQMSGLFCT